MERYLPPTLFWREPPGGAGVASSVAMATVRNRWERAGHVVNLSSQGAPVFCWLDPRWYTQARTLSPNVLVALILRRTPYDSWYQPKPTMSEDHEMQPPSHNPPSPPKTVAGLRPDPYGLIDLIDHPPQSWGARPSGEFRNRHV